LVIVITVHQTVTVNLLQQQHYCVALLPRLAFQCHTISIWSSISFCSIAVQHNQPIQIRRYKVLWKNLQFANQSARG